MSAIRQILAVSAIGLRAIPQRPGPSLVVIVGMASVVAVTISILSMSTGFMRTVATSGRPDRALVLSRNAQFEGASAITRDDLPAIADAPGIKRAADGKPLLSAEALANVALTQRKNGLDVYVTLRGMGPQGLGVRPEIRLVSGRMFHPGAHEVMVGEAARREFSGLDVGSRISLPEGDWTVTGTFQSGGNQSESEIFTDSETLLSEMRANAFKSVTVMLTGADRFNAFKHALTANPRVSMDVFRETDYFAMQAEQLNGFLIVVAYMVGGIMGLGALFGALNTLYSAVSTRSSEIATLRIFGFGAASILTSVLAEALVLSLLGAALGAFAAWAAFNGNPHAAGSLVFRLSVTPGLIIQGMAFSCALGLIGGLFPALRAARLPIAVALRAG